MNYNNLKNPSIYDDVYVKKTTSSYQNTETPDPRKNKKWPMKTPGLPQYVCVTYYTAKALGYDQLFPKYSRSQLVTQHEKEFSQTNFINFYVSMKDGFKGNFTESDYKHYVNETGQKKILDEDWKLFYQEGLTKATKVNLFTHITTNEQVKVNKLIYQPKLQVIDQDLRLLTHQKTKIKVTTNRESFITRGKIVAFSWHSREVDLKQTASNESYYEVRNDNIENIISPPYPMLIELVFRQLQTKDVLEGTLADDPRKIGTNELAIAANYLLNLNKVTRIYDVLKQVDKNPYQDKSRIKSDKDYAVSNTQKGQKPTYPLEFIRSKNYEEWSLIYKRDVIDHNILPESSGDFLYLRDELNELINLSINLEYITDKSIFPNELHEHVNRPKAIRDVQNIARKLNAALFLEPTIGVAIIGHTDCEGGFDYNLELSKKRATSIQTYLRELSKVDLGGIENLIKHEGRSKVLGAGMIDCVAWDNDKLRKKSDSELWENEKCRKISFEFFIID